MPSFKNFLLFGPLLWLRKIILYLLGLSIALGFVLYFVANSPLVIKKVAEHFAPDYNITYSRIYGNALTGVEIDDLAYNSEPLADYVALRWNPHGLVKKKIIISKLEIENANVDTIETLINTLPSDKNASVDVNHSEPFIVEVEVKNAALSVVPFIEQGITVSTLRVEMKDVHYDHQNVEVGRASLHTESNVTDVMFDGAMKNGTVTVKSLQIKALDLLALQSLYLSKKSDTVSVREEKEMVETSTDTSNFENPMIPKWVKVDNFEVDLLPLYYEPVDIKSLEIKGEEAVLDIENLLLQKANIDLNTTTNLSNIFYTTRVENNKLIGKVDFKPKKKLFKHFELPIRHEAVGDISVDLNVSQKELAANLEISMQQILQAQEDDYNFDIDNLRSKLHYDIHTAQMKVISMMHVTTPYAKRVFISNIFEMDDKIHYSGEIKAKELQGIQEKFLVPLKDLEVVYSGDTKSVDTKIDAKNLKGFFVSHDFKTAHLHLETKEGLLLREFVELPVELNQTKADLKIDAPLSFEKNATLTAYAKLTSNVLSLDANISYDDILHIESIGHIPEDSLLKAYSEDLKWESLNPIKTDATLKDDHLGVNIQAGALKSVAGYHLTSEELNATIDIDGFTTEVSGKIDETLTVGSKIKSIPAMMSSIESIYSLGTVPDIKGSVDLSAKVSELKSADISLVSPQIIYEANKDSIQVIDDIMVDFSVDASELVLKKYQLTYEEQQLFSTKPSRISLIDQNITVDPVWLNDSLQVRGFYDTNASYGEINATATTLHIDHKIVELDSALDIQTLFDGNKTSVKGEVYILGGNIYYDLAQKKYASDSDILIVQELKDEEPSSFMKHLSVNVQLKSKEPLVYKKGPVDIKAKADLGIYKAEGGELMLLGSVELLKGGSYLFEGKKFVLDQSYIHFTGDANKPLIEAVVNYKSLNHLITITVSGAPDTLHINFSSVPSLSKEQILSIILFDSQEGAGTNSGENMMKMMGGAMAKSVLSNIGVEIDHLVLGSGNSIEVGKKLTDEMTIIYINDVVAEVKLKYEHTNRLESVISADEESQSYDIIYKRDF